MSSAVHIQEIQVRGFRAFPGDQTYPIKLRGKNLLIHGENGSGKSSLFKALRVLLTPYPGLEDFDAHKNVFVPSDDGFIRVDISNSTPSEYHWDQGTLHPAREDGQPFMELARRCTFLDYKDLLRTSFLHEDNAEVDLGELIIHLLLRDTELSADGTLLKNYANINATRLEVVQAKQDGVEEEELADMCSSLQAALTSFWDEVNGLLNLAEGGVVQRANGLLQQLDKDLSITLVLEPITLITESDNPGLVTPGWQPPKAILSCNYSGHTVTQPASFLNEARLTAVALALFLAASERNTPQAAIDQTRILVLDDVLIGLDNSHRLSVLQMLSKEFKQWQIILLTYDRVWFEIAREYLGNSKWLQMELIETPVMNGPGQPLLQSSVDHIQQAREHLAKVDLMAAAVHGRAAFEGMVKKFCEDLHVAVPFKSDPTKVKVDALWTLLRKEVRHTRWRNPVDTEVIRGVNAVRSKVFNALSHHNRSTLVRKNIADGLDALEKLRAQAGKLKKK